MTTSKYVFKRYAELLVWSALILFFCGCGELPSKVASKMLSIGSFHQKVNWEAEDFFEDTQVIKLCHAIEANDLPEMKRLIEAGADVNARGKGNMTPLMWAFPDDKLARFELLLEHGADPNVVITDNLGVPSGFMAGDSVTTMAAKTRFLGYFEAVMAHGGDPNLRNGFKEPVLHAIIDAPIGDTQSRCSIALKHGADIECRWAGMTCLMSAVKCRKFELAIFFLERGADCKAYAENELQRVIHILLIMEDDLRQYPSEELQRSFNKLLEMLQEKGEDVVSARADLKRWSEKIMTPGGYKSRWQLELKAKRDRVDD